MSYFVDSEDPGSQVFLGETMANFKEKLFFVLPPWYIFVYYLCNKASYSFTSVII